MKDLSVSVTLWKTVALTRSVISFIIDSERIKGWFGGNIERSGEIDTVSSRSGCFPALGEMLVAFLGGIRSTGSVKRSFWWAFDV